MTAANTSRYTNKVSEESNFDIDKILGKKKNEKKNNSNSSDVSLEKSILKIIKKD